YLTATPKPKKHENHQQPQNLSLSLSLSLICSVICLMPTAAKAQWYGQKTYMHDSTVLCAAKRTVNTPGYIMAGFRKARQNGSGQPDFVIDKTDVNGQFTTLNDFTNEYQLGSFNCNPGATQHRCLGIDLVETKNVSSAFAYAAAVTDPWGVYFIPFDLQGNVY